MRTDRERRGVGRRGLLQGIGLAAGGAAAGAVASAAGASDEVQESAEEQSKPRYRETEEVRRFYALNRL